MGEVGCIDALFKDESLKKKHPVVLIGYIYFFLKNETSFVFSRTKIGYRMVEAWFVCQMRWTEIPTATAFRQAVWSPFFLELSEVDRNVATQRWVKSVKSQELLEMTLIHLLEILNKKAAIPTRKQSSSKHPFLKCDKC